MNPTGHEPPTAPHHPPAPPLPGTPPSPASRPQRASDAPPPRDVDLLRIELGVIWHLDSRGRLPGPEDLVIGVASDGLTAAVSSRLPDHLADRLIHLATSATPSPPGTPPDVLAECRKLLSGGESPATRLDNEVAASGGTGDGVVVSSGPSYVLSPPVQAGVEVEVLRSDEPAHARLVRPLRPETWEPEKWDVLVSGGEGSPWAMIVEDGQVVAVCHTPRLTPLGAEAGTWTSPSYRGRGYAAATTATWAELLPGIQLFYSTSADNRSSQRVAERLGLRQLGWFWKLTL
jgi:Acetyltransferase (GNAT) domain